MSFGQNLRRRRLSMGWTQQQLADRMGKTKNNISQYELGKREPNCDQLLSFARLLDISIDQLLGREECAALCEYAPMPYEGAPVLAPLYTGAALNAPVDYKYAPQDLPDPQTLFYFRAPDDSMADYRIRQGDLLLLRRSNVLESGAMHLLRATDGRVVLRMVRADSGGRYLLQASAHYAPEWLDGGSVHLLGRLLRVEFAT